MKTPLLDIVKTRPLIGDGAMGTQLMLAGLEQGGCGEAWNLTHPERVLAIQKRYADAGADCIITNTFGGRRIMLRPHEHEKELAAINAAGVRITREAFGGRPGSAACGRTAPGSAIHGAACRQTGRRRRAAAAAASFPSASGRG